MDNIKKIRRENLRILCKHVGGTSKLALKLNKTPSQLSQLLSEFNTKNIGHKIANEIEKSFGKPCGWLDNEHHSIGENLFIYKKDEYPSILCRQIPLITWEEAKYWHKLSYNYKHPSNGKTFTSSVNVSNLAFALEIIGDSMESQFGMSFHDGTIIVVDPEQIATHQSFVVAVVSNEKNAVFKQLVFDGSHRYLKPLNMRYPIVELNAHSIVCGVVKQTITILN